jgi:hypothetical protein
VFEYSIRDFFETQTEAGVERVVASSCWLGNAPAFEYSIRVLPPSGKGKEPNPMYDAIFDDATNRPSGNFRIEVDRLPKKVQPKTLYVTLRKRIKDKKLDNIRPSFRSGELYIIKGKD